jgi:hypothetical protein
MRNTWIVALLLMGAGALWAVDEPKGKAPAGKAAAADQDDVRDRLGERFTSRGRGVSFRPPIGGAQIKRTPIGMEIVRYSAADEKWSLNVSMMTFDKPVRLVSVDNPTTPEDESKTKPGILQQIVGGLLQNNVNTAVLRQDVVNLGTNDVGMIVARYAQGGQTMLRQQAIIQRNDQLFYVLDFTSPSGRTPADGPNVEDPAERVAVDIFAAVLDSVQLLDQKALLADEEERLYRTRTLLVNLPKKIQSTVTPEQYFRVMQGEKDVGWMYVTEELGERQGENGFFVASLSEATPQANLTLKVASEMFCSLNLKKAKEAWVTVNVIEKGGVKSHASEFGQSEKKNERMEKELEARDDPKAPTLKMAERYHFHVTQTDNVTVTPIERDLPPFYVSQAISAMLPRLVPLTQAKGYLFLVWVGSERELIKRYIDVEPVRTETFNGQTNKMIVVKDRIGLEAEPILHYFTVEGRYLGSFNKASGVTIASSSQELMVKLWPNATFARPQVLDRPQERN